MDMADCTMVEMEERENKKTIVPLLQDSGGGAVRGLDVGTRLALNLDTPLSPCANECW